MTVWPGVFFLELPGGCQLSLSGLEGLCWGIRPIRPSAGLASSATGLTGRLKSGLQVEGEARQRCYVIMLMPLDLTDVLKSTLQEGSVVRYITVSLVVW